ncbi:hypothetical protein ACIQOU_12415 [Streptomyces sp. NPDC091279]|uniref:hypothetical protein n=1 Tax=unclassified Streptomyces TaxID=2593676 RepID=UPI0038113201
MNMESTLKEAMAIEGALGVALVDYESGMSLGVLGGGPHLDLEVAAAGNTEVLRAKQRTLKSIDMDDQIEDILITLGHQYHLVRPLVSTRGTLFLYLALDRNRSNLALARHSLKRLEASMEI